ncbi:hypothetical protein SLA2020_418570 [Shorea laevis]
MNQNYLFSFLQPFSPLINLLIFTLFCLERKILAVDFHYTACNVPTTCGSQEIKFPFYIPDQQESFCEHPGFELSCRNNKTPILTLPNNDDYTIQEIFYQNQSLRVSNSVVSDAEESYCIPPIKNISIPYDRFKLASNQRELVLLSGCNLTGAKEFSQYKVNCSGQKMDDSVLALFGDDPVLGNASEKCREAVVAAVDVGEEGGVEDMLRRGFVMEWMASNCSICEASGGICGFDKSTYRFNCFCPDRPHSWHCAPKGRGKGFVIKVAAGTSAVGIGGLIILAFYFRKKFSTGNGIFSGLMKKDDCENIEAFLRDNMHLALKRYSFKNVTKMTNNFRDKLGEGGFGSVYKGKLSNGSQVAVKVLDKSKDNGEAFINEVASISRTSHVNIVTLLGFCFKDHIRVLIYEFVPNGSLEKLIHEESALNGYHHLKWETLHQIAIGIARGLEYLHCRCNTRILHFDIKPHNILLDNDFCPKISDFGLAKLCPKRESIVSMTGVRGTIGYIAPEVFCRNIGRVSHKSDVYSYGMMILDMVGARKNINAESDHSSEYFPQWIYRRLELDEELGFWSSMNENDKERARKMIIVGLWCIQTHPSNRPPMYRVVEMLQGNLDSLEIPPKSFLSSPPRLPADANIDFDSSSSLIL